jgi:hypothetical protein
MIESPANRRTFLSGALITAAALSLPDCAARAKEAGSQHVVLLGDSILDNGAYVGGGPDVVHQLRGVLPKGARATLAAVDGSVASGVRLQLQIAPTDATHLVVSAGGNDALHYANVLKETAGSVSEALEKLAAVREWFVQDYRAMLDDVQGRGLPVAVCTIYDAHFPDARQRGASPRSGSPSSMNASRGRRRRAGSRLSIFAWFAARTRTSPTRSSPR